MLQLKRAVRGKVKEKEKRVCERQVQYIGGKVKWPEGGEQRWSEKVKRRENDKIFKLLLKFVS
jgi:hypothetical protein